MTHVIGTHGNVEVARSTFRRARLQRPQTDQGTDVGARPRSAGQPASRTFAENSSYLRLKRRYFPTVRADCSTPSPTFGCTL